MVHVKFFKAIAIKISFDIKPTFFLKTLFYIYTVLTYDSYVESFLFKRKKTIVNILSS